MESTILGKDQEELTKIRKYLIREAVGALEERT